MSFIPWNCIQLQIKQLIYVTEIGCFQKSLNDPYIKLMDKITKFAALDNIEGLVWNFLNGRINEKVNMALFIFRPRSSVVERVQPNSQI